MRSRIIVSKTGQTLIARGKEYVSADNAAFTVATSRQFDESVAENRLENRGPSSSNRSLERAWIYGNPREVAAEAARVNRAEKRAEREAVKAALRAENLAKLKALPVVSNEEALRMIAASRAMDEANRLAEIEEEKEARRAASSARMSALKGLAG